MLPMMPLRCCCAGIEAICGYIAAMRRIISARARYARFSPPFEPPPFTPMSAIMLHGLTLD